VIGVPSACVVCDSGYTAMGSEVLDTSADVPKQGDSKEGIYIGRELSEEELKLPLNGPNQYPPEVHSRTPFP
jgi:isopenicillin N synthase-like dioxygenase